MILHMYIAEMSGRGHDHHHLPTFRPCGQLSAAALHACLNMIICNLGLTMLLVIAATIASHE